jgi:hypothetical protein
VSPGPDASNNPSFQRQFNEGRLLAGFSLMIARLRINENDVRFGVDCVAKRFCAPKSATLIQDQAAARNIDSKKCSSRFDYCQIANPRRVLQHNPPESGHVERQD